MLLLLLLPWSGKSSTLAGSAQAEILKLLTCSALSLQTPLLPSLQLVSANVNRALQTPLSTLLTAKCPKSGCRLLPPRSGGAMHLTSRRTRALRRIQQQQCYMEMRPPRSILQLTKSSTARTH
jgi:hypothetical protein